MFGINKLMKLFILIFTWAISSVSMYAAPETGIADLGDSTSTTTSTGGDSGSSGGTTTTTTTGK